MFAFNPLDPNPQLYRRVGALRVNRHSPRLILVLSLLLGLFVSPKIMRADATHTLIIIVNPPEGGVTIPAAGVHQYPSGTSVDLSKTANPGYTFVGWSGDAGCANERVIMGSDKTCIATFTFTGYTVTVHTTGSGVVTSNPAGIHCGNTCVAAFDAGSTVTLTANPNVGSIFTGWGGACSGTGSCVVNSTQTVSASFVDNTGVLTIGRAGTGNGTVTSTPAGIHCGITCTASFTLGTLITLTATPNTGSQFSGWSGAADCTDGVVTMVAGLTCTANFTLLTHTLTVTTSGNGSGVVAPEPGSYVYDYGTVVHLAATAAYGSLFTGWSGDPICTTSVSTLTITITADLTCTASFTLKTYTLTPSAGPGGSITPNQTQTVLHGSAFTFTLTPNAGYGVAGVWVDGVYQGALNSYTFSNITASHTISAAFGLNTHIITPTAGTNGNITPNTPQIIAQGNSITFTITPNLGYHIANVWVDGVAQGAIASHTFANITASHTITAAFAMNTYTLTVNAAGTGSGIVTPSVGTHVYVYGTVVTLTATANPGSVFTGWSGDCFSTGSCVVTMTSSQNVVANFKRSFIYLPFVGK